MDKKKFISWRRVSTWKQGRSGLGLEAQASIIEYFVEKEQGEIIADYCEVYTGTDLAGCAELHKAVEHCKASGASLVIAKADRFRNDIEALQIYKDLKGHIFFCDLGVNADDLIIKLSFILAAREAELISVRTKSALEAKRARGEAVGGAKTQWGKNTPGADRNAVLIRARKKMVESKREAARSKPANSAFWYFIQDWQKIHGELGWQADWKSVSDELNLRGHKTATGLDFTPLRARSMFMNVSKLYSEV